MFECFKIFSYQILKAYVLLQCFLKSCTWQIYFAHAQSKSSVNRFNWAEEAECVMTLWNSPCLEIPPAGGTSGPLAFGLENRRRSGQ